MTTNTQVSHKNTGRRNVIKILSGRETSDGAGVRLTRYIASPDLDMLDPFLLLDAFHSDDPDDYIAGFPPHPHRGFETVTYLINGRFRHKDSAGNEGVIKAGGVQWMTAGRGIEHSEMPEQEQGLVFGFQLWVNLPASKKMMAPRYQEIDAKHIPVEIRDNGIKVKVIAGTTIEGTEGAVKDIEAAPLYLDISLPAGQNYIEQVVEGHSAFVLVIKGGVEIKGGLASTKLEQGSLGVLSDGEQLHIDSDRDSRLLLIAGKPFNEPVARYGPFVMNRPEEIEQAFEDYRAGKFGFVKEANE
ncbi:MAG: pirin family protein [Gammaproteobacteria bacterium]